MTAREPSDASARLSHTGEGGTARMVDVGDKSVTARSATAAGEIVMSREALEAIRDNTVAKGDVLAVARIAGIMAAKKTAELIPLCHQLPLSSVSVELAIDDVRSAVTVRATANTSAQTGVEMEAIIAATIALVTVYDMTKSADRAMTIGSVRLLRKSGGRSGDYVRAED